ncbi:hypothetical protein ACFO0N_19285 [Halobium salinum]|uniref:Uncharacterized protein n=1 Tax=Halobium salinum TaxID=1364940 RepID=A0ABD5PHA4_9EURY|nr:hypothetical protein [Halobium salinum]
MSASGSDLDVRDPRIAVQLLLLAAYVALVLYAGATGDPLAGLAVDIAFSVATVVFGLYLSTTAAGDSLRALAAGAFVGTGVTQAIALFGVAFAAQLSDLFLVAALVLFVVIRFRR